MESRCGDRVCCQALTSSGSKCTRAARFQLDLTKERKVMGITIPRVKCCFFCTQHLIMYTGIAASKISQIIAESKLDWDEYIALNPEYIDKLEGRLDM